MAHARRKFWDVHERTKSALSRLERIAAFYKIDDTVRGQPPDQRLRVRTQHLAALMADMHVRLGGQLHAHLRPQ
jgi:hypothetical protein